MHSAPSKLVDNQTNMRYLQSMLHWSANGKIAISREQENLTASFTWEQKEDQYHIHFYSPFSTDTVTINGIGQQFTALSQNNDDTDLLMEQELPFAQLGAWLKGLVYAGSNPQTTEYNSCGQLKLLWQDGWLVEYATYDVYQSILLPKKITISKGALRAKILIKNWGF